MKKTEEELRQEIVDEFTLEEGDERIDKILEIKKDRFTATQAKKKAQKEAEDFKKGKDFYKKQIPKKGEKPKGDEGKEPKLSVEDSARLMEAKIPVDDWGEVTSYAEFKKINIKDALENSVVKSTLAEKAEARKTNDATNTKKGKRGSSKVSGESLLEQAESSGKLPETDEEMEALVDARYKA